MARPKNFGLSKPLKTRTVLKNFKADENLTFEALAEDYGMVEQMDKFLELLHKTVGNDNFSDMERINAKRLKRGKGCPVIIDMKENDTMKAKIITDLKSKAQTVVTTTETKTNEEEKTMKENNNDRTKEMIQSDLANIEELIKLTISQRDTVQALLDDITNQVCEQKALVDKLSNELETAKQTLVGIESEMTDNTAQLNSFEDELTDLFARKKSLEEELVAKEKVYLLAPGMKGGKLSPNKTYISTTEKRQGVKFVRIPSEDWAFNWPTNELMAKAAKYGYTDFNRLFEDIEFAQLVIYYRLNNKPFELIADHNPSVLAIIEDEYTGA